MQILIQYSKYLIIFPFVCISLFAFGQSGSEIYLFDMKVSSDKIVLSNGVNITNHKGYDNQPFFHPVQPIIYYSSFDDSARSDIKTYNYTMHQTSNFTKTRDREYSPTVTPDGEYISCIIQRDNGVQDLAKYPIEGGKPQVLINHLKIGYHAWASNDRLFMFVLDDSVHNSLHYYYLEKNADTVIAENIGRSLHKIPGQNAMSFVQRVNDKESVIKKYDLNTGIINSIINSLPGQDHLCWLQNGIILMSDGNKIFSYKENSFTELKDRKWEPITIEGNAMLKGVTRLASNPDNTKLAVVVSE